MIQSGQLFILSAPSGAGKTTLLKKVMQEVVKLAFSVSHTTRSPRRGETDGVDYHFVSVDEFKAMRDQNLFLEWAEVHGNFYGTSRPAVEKQLTQGIDIILDIDVQGAAIIAADKSVHAVSVFVAPPSLDELERRLRGRGTDNEETIMVRLGNAAKEMSCADDYEYLVINDDIEEAAATLQAVLIAERSRGHRLPSGDAINLDGGK